MPQIFSDLFSSVNLKFQVPDRLRLMFCNAYDRSLMAHATYKRYVDKYVSVTRRLNDGDMVTGEHPTH